MNRDYLERFLSKPTVQVLEASLETADIFGMLKDNLKSAGTPLPIKDIWIASHAIETGSVLVTYDRHFIKNRRPFAGSACASTISLWLWRPPTSSVIRPHVREVFKGGFRTTLST